MAASACNTFRPNLWRPSTCANCYRPKAKHCPTARSASPQPASADRIPMGRARSQSCREAKSPAGEGKQVGVVKPYAVVELPADSARDGRYKKVPRGVGQESKTPVEKGRRQTISGLVRRGSSVIAPKRKAPPPPPRAEKPKVKKLPSPHPVRRNSAMRRTNGVIPAGQSHDRSQPNPLESEEKQPRTGSSASPPPPPRPPWYRGRVLTLSASSSSSAPPELRGGTSRAHTATAVHQQRSRSMTVSTGRSPSVSPQPWRVSMASGSPQPRRRSASASGSHSVSPGGNGSKSPQLRGRAVTVSTGGNGSRKKKPPQKPPRTLSTFISSSEQSSLLNQLLTEGAMCSQQPLALNTKVQCADSTNPGHSDSVSSSSNTAALRHERSSSSGSSVLQSPTCSVFVSPGQLHSQILHLLQETLQRVREEYVEGLVCTDDLWGVEWGELEVRSWKTLGYKGIPLSLEVVAQELDEGTQAELELSKRLRPHLHLALGSKYILRDCVDGGRLDECLAEKRKTLSPEAYVELVLFSLVQLLSAVKHVHSQGVCHRDVGLDCLYVTSSPWLVKLGNFNYALHGPATFTYGYHELRWLGGADSRLPPEVMDTSEQTQSLDYSHTDSFAVGCIIHEVLGSGNPFELDPDLVYRQYTPGDLPPLPTLSPLTPHLQRLTNLLLCRDPTSRLGPSTALLITQALLWLPTQWFREPISEPQLRHHLSYEKAILVSSMAASNTRPHPLPSILKAQFLLSCDVAELLEVLSLFNTQQ